MKKWPCPKGWKASEEDPSFCANCGNIASGHKGPTPGAPRSFRLPVPVKPDALDKLAYELADKFLRWPLPQSVCADGCATDANYKHTRSGTNLLNIVEARQMMRDVVLTTLRERGIKL